MIVKSNRPILNDDGLSVCSIMLEDSINLLLDEILISLMDKRLSIKS